MKKKLMLGTAATAAVAVGVLVAPLAAQAGHANTVLEGSLSGRAEVQTDGSQRIAGDPNGSGEVYVFGIDGDPTTLCYVLTVDKIADVELAPGAPRAAHIHRGVAGANGPVEVNLAWPQGGQAADCLTEGEAGKGLTAGEVQAILADPASYYVNVHNSEYPGGAIRAQLESAH